MTQRSKGKHPRTKQGSIRPIVCSSTPEVSIVIPASNERRTIAHIIRNAWRVHPETEVIVVVNGSNDGTRRIASRMGARVIQYADRLGHDVGRSIGAREARGDIIVFVDGDFILTAAELLPFVTAVKSGTADIALNKYLGPVHHKRVHKVVLAKHALNAALGRSDLGGASMTTVPHALSRQALDSIGLEHLAVPPKAQAIAIIKGLRLQPVQFINAGRRNRKRRRTAGIDPVGDMIVGDHLEAMQEVMQQIGFRGGNLDLSRDRARLRW